MSARGPRALAFAAHDRAGDIRAFTPERGAALLLEVVGMLVGVPGRGLLVGADDGERVLVGAGIARVGDVALARRVADEHEDQAAHQENHDQRSDDVTHAVCATRCGGAVKPPPGLGRAWAWLVN